MVKKPVTTLLDPKDIRKLKTYKKEKGIEVSAQIRQFVKEGLQLRERREKWVEKNDQT